MAMAASVLLLLILVRQSVGQVSPSTSSSSSGGSSTTTTITATAPPSTSPHPTHTPSRISVNSTATQGDLLLLSTSASPLHTKLYNSTDNDACFIHLLGPETDDIPSVVARLPATISVSSLLGATVPINISLVFVDEIGRPLACIVFNPSGWKTLVYQYLGYCGHGEAVDRLIWISWPRNKYKGWPKSLRSFNGYGYFHMQAEVTPHPFHGKPGSTIAVRPNGQEEDSLSMTVKGLPKFLYVFANAIELGVNLLSFHGGCTASTCMRVESFTWIDTIYFLPDEVAGETVINTRCCWYPESITYRANTSERLWHTLTFGENSVSEVDYIKRSVFVDGEEVGEIRVTNDQVSQKFSYCLPYECELDMEGAIWTLGCDPNNGAAGHPDKSSAPKVIEVLMMVQLLVWKLMMLT